mmetsp:Transcript_6647/g.23497  ORF Transcript_6647/g.23497 Transcript_6647/m.23497 type:complete len:201 (-) Transcript_6647:302-904(-)
MVDSACRSRKRESSCGCSESSSATCSGGYRPWHPPPPAHGMARRRSRTWCTQNCARHARHARWLHTEAPLEPPAPSGPAAGGGTSAAAVSPAAHSSRHTRHITSSSSAHALRLPLLCRAAAGGPAASPEPSSCGPGAGRPLSATGRWWPGSGRHGWRSVARTPSGRSARIRSPSSRHTPSGHSCNARAKAWSVRSRAARE